MLYVRALRRSSYQHATIQPVFFWSARLTYRFYVYTVSFERLFVVCCLLVCLIVCCLLCPLCPLGALLTLCLLSLFATATFDANSFILGGAKTGGFTAYLVSCHVCVLVLVTHDALSPLPIDSRTIARSWASTSTISLFF